MSICFDCAKTATNDNETQTKILEEAQALANKSGQWVALYRDERNELQYSVAQYAPGNIQQWISPKLPDASL